MSRQRIEIEVDVPEGFGATGEFRPPQRGEWFIAINGQLMEATESYVDPRIILRRVEPKRESRWVNVYGPTCDHATKEAAAQVPSRVGCVRLNYENDKLVSVSLEEGKG